jgi:hypothetical protein
MTTARERSNQLAALLRNEQSAMADFLVALAVFDRQGAWRELGHASLFSFLHVELGLSKGAAHYRKVAAELVQHFPQVVEPLRDGRLCISSIVELAKVMTAENADEVLPRFFHVSKREAMVVSAAIRPVEEPPLRTLVTAVRGGAAAPVAVSFVAPSQQARAVEATPTAAGSPHANAVQPVELVDAKVPDASPDAPISRECRTVQPLTGDLSRLHVTVSRRFLEKLQAARDALSHSHPGASEEELLEAGLDLLLDKAAKRRGLVEKPRKNPPASESDAVPAHVKRAVWLRSGGKCEWRLDSGGVCGSTHQLELDHHPIPKAHGGPATIDNIRIHCKTHNLEGARRVFGDAWMDRYTRGSGRGVWTSDSSAPSAAGVQRAPTPRDTTSTTGAERP